MISCAPYTTKYICLSLLKEYVEINTSSLVYTVTHMIPVRQRLGKHCLKAGIIHC
jgi:hypothetical protein